MTEKLLIEKQWLVAVVVPYTRHAAPIAIGAVSAPHGTGCKLNTWGAEINSA